MLFRSRIPDDLLVVAHANKGSEVAAPFPVVRLEFDPAESAAAMGELLCQTIRRAPVTDPIRRVGFHWRAPAALASSPSAVSRQPSPALP